MKRTIAFLIGVLMLTSVIGIAPLGAASAEGHPFPEDQWGPLHFRIGGALEATNPMIDFITEKFNFTFEMVAVEGDKINMLMVADDVPDFYSEHLGLGRFYEARADGYLKELTDDILQWYPNVQGIIGDGMNAKSIKQAYDGYWSIPRFADGATRATLVTWYILYRGDWADALGIPEPTNMYELADMARAFTFNDPDDNGVDDTYGVSGWFWGPLYYPWLNYDNWVLGEDGLWTPSIYTKEMRDALVFWNGLYKEGVIDPEFDKGSQADFFGTDKIGIYLYRFDEHGIRNNVINVFNPAHPGVDGLSAIRPLPVMSLDADSPKRAGQYQNDTYSGVFSAKDCTDEMLHRILSVYEWLYTDEGRDFVVYGFEGTDWQKTPEGKAESLLGDGVFLYEKYSSGDFFSLFSWDFAPATPRLVPLYDPRIIEISDACKAAAIPHLYTKDNPLIEIIETPASLNFKPEFYEETFNRLIASDDAGAGFDEMMEMLRNVHGYDQMIKEKNETYQEMISR